jgi:hypothetical protein
MFAASALGPGTALPSFFPTDVTRQDVNMMLKSVILEKCSDIAYMKGSACLFAHRDFKCGIDFCNCGNTLKYEAMFPSIYLMNRVKKAMTSLSLATSVRFRVVRTSVSPFSFKSQSSGCSV